MACLCDVRDVRCIMRLLLHCLLSCATATILAPTTDADAPGPSRCPLAARGPSCAWLALSRGRAPLHCSMALQSGSRQEDALAQSPDDASCCCHPRMSAGAAHGSWACPHSSRGDAAPPPPPEDDESCSCSALPLASPSGRRCTRGTIALRVLSREVCRHARGEGSQCGSGLRLRGGFFDVLGFLGSVLVKDGSPFARRTDNATARWVRVKPWPNAPGDRTAPCGQMLSDCGPMHSAPPFP